MIDDRRLKNIMDLARSIKEEVAAGPTNSIGGGNIAQGAFLWLVVVNNSAETSLRDECNYEYAVRYCKETEE